VASKPLEERNDWNIAADELNQTQTRESASTRDLSSASSSATLIPTAEGNHNPIQGSRVVPIRQYRTNTWGIEEDKAATTESTRTGHAKT